MAVPQARVLPSHQMDGIFRLTGNESTLEELRVLVVDDNVDAATSFCMLLQVLGCKTAVAFDGATGVRVAELFRPHLAFFDLDMPGADGCAAVEVLRASKEHGDTVFVCLTGRSDEFDQARCLAAGFHHFVSKPLNPEVLSALLMSCGRVAPDAGVRRAD